MFFVFLLVDFYILILRSKVKHLQTIKKLFVMDLKGIAINLAVVIVALVVYDKFVKSMMA